MALLTSGIPSRPKAAESEEYVAEAFRKSRIPFRRSGAIGGLVPDFVIEVPDGRRFVVEVKAWEANAKNLRRAAKQVSFYRHATGADKAFVVIPGLKRDRPAEGVVSDRAITDLLSDLIVHKTARRKPRPVPPRAQRMIFAAMPFSTEFDDVYFVAMAGAATYVNAICQRVDREEFVGEITGKIKELVRKSIAVVADLSGANPNVMYEIGLAHALKRPTVQICSTPLSELPFDVRGLNTMKYTSGQTHRLVSPLGKRLKSVLEGELHQP